MMNDYTEKEIQIPTEAGDEIDRLIEEKIFGRIPCDDYEIISSGLAGNAWTAKCDHEGKCYWRKHPTQYSRNGQAMVLLIKRMAEIGFDFYMRTDQRELGELFAVTFQPLTRVVEYSSADESLPKAVAQAAKKTVDDFKWIARPAKLLLEHLEPLIERERQLNAALENKDGN